jgi:hypothetical protein
MLKAIEVEARARQASSLYCVWMRSAAREDAPLVAIWIDREMRAFADESVFHGDQGAVASEGRRDEGNLSPSEVQTTIEEEW